MTSKGSHYGWILLALVAWGIIFGTYEVIERTFLANSAPATLHILHIIRGTATSFILAALVAWYIMRQGTIKPTAKGEARGDERYEVSEEESIHRSLWLINLRWIAIVGVTLTTTIATVFFNALSRFSIVALGLIIGVMVLYNVAFLYAIRRTHTTKAVAFSQVLLDLISLTLMLHFSGGIENPFFTFFIFHVIIASILLQRKESYLIATVTCVLFTSMVLLEYLGWLTHYPLGMGLGGSILTLPYVVGILSAFCATTFFSAYFATTIMSDLRKRQQQLKATSEQLAHEMKRIREMEAELIQSSKMAAVGQLATGIAHEINNPLATISASTEFLQTYANKENRLSGLEPLTRHLQRIVDHVYRCKDIINNLLGFARKEETAISSVNINKVLSETARIVEQSTPLADKRLELKLADDIPHLPANEQQLQQVFMNLIHNALDVIPASGTVSIKSYHKDSTVRVEVSDTGCGIADDVLPRIFEPFFTTKPVGKGTGLGLYLCHQIITSLKGQITVESKVGVGTTFRIYLPIQIR